MLPSAAALCQLARPAWPATPLTSLPSTPVLQLDTRAREANRRQRAIFRHRIRAMYKWQQFVWMDEVGKVGAGQLNMGACP